MPCDVCGISFRTRELLKQHQEREHSECPRFACETCGQRFGNNYHLKRHEIIHTDEQYHCTMCSRRFKRKDGLDAHVAHMHESQTSQQTSSQTSAPTETETEATTISYEFDDQSGSLTDLINFQPLVEREEFYSSSTNTDTGYHDHHHNTQIPDTHDQDGSRVIDPFFDPAPVSCSSVTVSTPGEEPMFTVVSNLNNKMIMSELESLSQYKSTVVRAEMPYNTQVLHSSSSRRPYMQFLQTIICRATWSQEPAALWTCPATLCPW